MYKKSIDAKHQRVTPKEFDPGLHLNTYLTKDVYFIAVPFHVIWRLGPV
jgi:hypothetical protein